MNILVDGHVHFHPGFRPEVGLNAAVEAFRAARRDRGLGPDGPDCLVVVDPAGRNGFGRLRRNGAAGWSVGVGGPLWFTAVRESDGATALLLAGRQIRTEQNLEVLSFFSRAEIEEGLRLDASVEAVLQGGGVPVLPWSFGKWHGRRGRTVRRVLDSPLGRRVLVADSSTRPRLLPEPALFERARSRGIPVLAGSDPLPFPRQERTIGRYGFVLNGDLGRCDPATALKQKLLAEGTSPEIYGRRENLAGALMLQLRMQLRRLRPSNRNPHARRRARTP